MTTEDATVSGLPGRLVAGAVTKGLVSLPFWEFILFLRETLSFREPKMDDRLLFDAMEL